MDYDPACGVPDECCPECGADDTHDTWAAGPGVPLACPECSAVHAPTPAVWIVVVGGE